MGLFSVFIPVDKFEQDFIDSFNKNITKEDYDYILEPLIQTAQASRNLKDYAKVCAARIAKEYRNVLNQAKQAGQQPFTINQFYAMPYERALCAYLADNFAKDGTLLRMMQIGKGKNNEPGITILISSIAAGLDVVQNTSKDYQLKQADAFNEQIKQILVNVRDKEGPSYQRTEKTADPFYSEENISELKDRIENINNGTSVLKEHELIETSYCRYCGAKIPVGSMFCNKCGKKL